MKNGSLVRGSHFLWIHEKVLAVVEVWNVDKNHEERTSEASGGFGGKGRLADNEASDEQIEHRARGTEMYIR